MISSSNKSIECTPSLSDIGSCNNDKHYSVKNPIDKSIVNNNSNKVLLSIREHKASAVVNKRFNKDIAKKLSANRKTINPPLSVIAPNESCQSIFKNLHYQPVSHVKSQALVKFIFHAESYLQSEFHTMTNAEIADKSSVICPNFTLDKATKEANVDYIVDRFILDYLHMRERWVTNLAYHAYQTKQLPEDICNKLELANDKDADDIVLGKLAHCKNFIPFFPQHSFKNGEQYDFTKRDRIVKDICKSNVKVTIKNFKHCDSSNEDVLKAISNVEDRIKLLNENREYVCDQNCISTSENEIFRLTTCLEKCSKISYKAFRNVIEEFEMCGTDTQDKAAYTFNRFPRNHPSECYLENSDCNSEFVLLRKVGVHSSNMRQFYDKINLVKRAHNFLSDLDTSFILKDIDYIIKLTKYIPANKSKVLDNISRNSCIVNENTVMEQYCDQYSDFLKKLRSVNKA